MRFFCWQKSIIIDIVLVKKIILYIIPFLIIIIAFWLLVYFVNQKSGKGALQVTSLPSSKVYIDGKFIGTTPLCKCEASSMLPVGDYTISLTPSEGDFKPFQEKITINKSTLTVVDRVFAGGSASSASIITLSPISDKKSTELLVISFPQNAYVFLDNSPVGMTPLKLKNVTDSDHDLKITKDGYSDKLIRIKTTPGFQLKAVVFLGINPNIASSSAQPVSSSSASPSITKILILNTPTGFLRIREGSSLGSRQIGQATPGETFDLIGETDGWYKIKLENGTEGWVSSQYAKKQ